MNHYGLGWGRGLPRHSGLINKKPHILMCLTLLPKGPVVKYFLKTLIISTFDFFSFDDVLSVLQTKSRNFSHTDCRL